MGQVSQYKPFPLSGVGLVFHAMFEKLADNCVVHMKSDPSKDWRNKKKRKRIPPTESQREHPKNN